MGTQSAVPGGLGFLWAMPTQPCKASWFSTYDRRSTTATLPPQHTNLCAAPTPQAFDFDETLTGLG